ncbi:MAG: GntR family transcriptional regulator [Rhodospirillum sp.]|nr:GntR family transcriptional regulator [Rhodospirillum sp.]MCF8490498.1 GntR family transcriptional regulator [Rhodospirillum sp.]
MAHGYSTKEAVAAVVASLEQRIIFGDLLPKQRLYEDEFILRYDTKRHVIRAALQELERRGIVERLPNRGAIVRFYSRDEVADLYVVRAILHEAAARLVRLPADPSWLAALGAARDVHAEAVRRRDLAEVFRSNTAFHQKLFEGTGNMALVETIEQSNARTHGIRSHGLGVHQLLERAREEHQAMVAAVERGDLEALARLCVEHMSPARRFYEEKYCGPIQWSA